MFDFTSNSNQLETNSIFKFNESNLYIEEPNNADQSNDINKIKRIRFKAIGITGATVFGLSNFSYLVSAVSIGATFIYTFGTGSYLVPMAGILSSGILPLAGPWVGTGLLIYMANNSSTVPDNYSGRPYDFYGGLIALCSILGVFEITGFILMLVGFIGYNNISVAMSIKKEKFSLFIINDIKGNVSTGVRIKL